MSDSMRSSTKAIKFSEEVKDTNDGQEQSESCRIPGSREQACGSMFATAIIDKLTIDPRTSQPLLTIADENEGFSEWTDDQHRSYANFCKAVYESLLPDTDRSVENLISTVKTVGANYLRTDPGGEDTANSGNLHYYIGRIIRDEEKDQAIVEEQLRVIQFRMEQLAAADRYLKIMGIPAPDGLSCCEFDTRSVPSTVADRKYEWIKDQIYEGDLLFPHPTEEQGYQPTKGPRYLNIAFHLAKTGDDEIVGKLNNLKEVIEAEVEQQIILLERDPEVTSKRQELFKAFNLDMHVAEEEKAPCCLGGR
ncbi:MAG: hypothetical protein Q9226_005692 [Calogaya cf. arnoldii]